MNECQKGVYTAYILYSLIMGLHLPSVVAQVFSLF